MMLFVQTENRKVCWAAKNLTACRKKVKELRSVSIVFDWVVHDNDDRMVDSSGTLQGWSRVAGATYEGYLYG